MTRFTMMSVLESRTLLSGDGNSGGDTSVLDADKASLAADFTKFNTDWLAAKSAVAADKASAASHKTDGNTGITNLNTQLKADQKSMIDELKQDSLAGKETSTYWMGVIKADEASIREHKKNPDQLATDKAKLESDRAAAKEARAPFEAEAKADIAKWNTKLATDKKAIEDAKKALAATCAADCAQLKKDQNYWRGVLNADRDHIMTDVKKFRADGGFSDLKIENVNKRIAEALGDMAGSAAKH